MEEFEARRTKSKNNKNLIGLLNWCALEFTKFDLSDGLMVGVVVMIALKTDAQTHTLISMVASILFGMVRL